MTFKANGQVNNVSETVVSEAQFTSIMVSPITDKNYKIFNEQNFSDCFQNPPDVR